MSSPPLCPNCGARQRRADARFCQNCGYPLTSTPTGVGSATVRASNKTRLWIGGALLLVLVLSGIFLLGPGRKRLPCCQPSDNQAEIIATRVPTPIPKPTKVANTTSPSSPLPTATPWPTSTPTPHPTATPTPRPTPTDTPVPLAHTTAVVWLRTGPGTDYQRIRKLAQGEAILLLGRNADRSWLQITTQKKESGWVSARYVDSELVVISTLPEAPAPPLPTCQILVDNRFQSVYQRDRFGCPTHGAHITWAAWEPFQGGAMLWRDDINVVTVFYQGDGWITLPDQWHGEPTPSRGNPPAGLRQPVRGFGWIWGNHDEVFNGLGWATDEEKGVCLIVQDFQKGFIFLKDNTPYCNDRSGNSNYNRSTELPNLFIAAYDHGRAWRIY